MNNAPELKIPHENWESRREVVQEVSYPKYWTKELASRMVQEIPMFLENKTPETPTLLFDLTDEGLSKILVKDESRLEINPTGTMKDRIGRDRASSYRSEASEYLESLESSGPSANEVMLPRYSLLTSGNAGMALAYAFEKYKLPAPKLLLDKQTRPEVLEKLRLASADVYVADLSTNPFSGKPSAEDPMTAEQIKIITNNDDGKDLTSSGGYNPQSDVDSHIFYHKIIGEVQSILPDEIYMPYGSGVLHSEFLMAQNFRAFIDNPESLSPKEKALFGRQEKIKIMGAEPKDPNSIADKLTAPAKPFAKHFQQMLEYYQKIKGTPPESGVGKVSEPEIEEAYRLMKKYGEPQGLRTEPSASAGLALYIKRKRARLVTENSKVVVINTGKGIISEK